MRKIVIELEQTTPMWHFQGGEPDCCLRVTEVKPKLDRFIEMRREGGVPDGWYVDKTHNSALKYKSSDRSEAEEKVDKAHNSALKYKMRISCGGRRELPDLISINGRSRSNYPVFFGNMGNQQGGRKRLMMFSDVNVTIISMEDELVDCIESLIGDFFDCHSFGTRQDKGFGCFRLKGTNGTARAPFGASYSFSVPRANGGEETFPELFKYINYFHKVIRSGVNEQGCYVKSLMYHYAKSKGDVWDKPVIRTNFQYFNPVYEYLCDIRDDFPDDARRRVPYPKKRECMMKEYDNSMDLIKRKSLYRDALGLSTSQCWRAYDDTIKTSLQDDPAAGVRFKSPIDYHPVPDGQGGFIVYITLHQIPDELRAESFRISDSRKDDDVDDLENMRIAERFSLTEYFQYILDNHKKLVSVDSSRVPGRYISHILGKDGNFSKIR